MTVPAAEMEQGVWLEFLGEDDVLSEEVVLESLAKAGVRVRGSGGSAAFGPGILVFDEISSSLCERLGEASGGGLERVLAIASSAQVLGRHAWRLLHAGASDAFAWDHFRDPGAEVAARFERWRVVDGLVGSGPVQDNLAGESPVWKSAVRRLVEVAHFTGASVLITGESGTGKELAARLIHELDRRPDKGDLVDLDCTTIVPELSGSEFFGHERGAFTDAVVARDGAFALANGGTLFLDEVGDLPLTLQPQLLRVVEDGTYKRVGSNQWRRTEFRLVCATNRDLPQAAARGEFRRDLYYRIASCPCVLPPLRDRTEDILPLVHHFVRQSQPDGDIVRPDESVRSYLLRRDYPGNVRDLRQLVARMMYRHVGPGPFTAGDIPEEERPAAEPEVVDWRDRGFQRAIRRAVSLGVGLKEIGRMAEEMAVRIAVRDEHGNLQRAARTLGVTDRALQMRRAAGRQPGKAPGGSKNG